MEKGNLNKFAENIEDNISNEIYKLIEQELNYSTLDLEEEDYVVN